MHSLKTWCSSAFQIAAPLLVLSCGGSQAPAEPSPSLGSPTWTEAPVVAPVEPEAPPRNVACSGSSLDASKLARSGVCNIEGHAKALPASIVASLASNSAQVISGQSTTVQIVLRNTGMTDVDLFLDHSCGFENLSTKVLLDSAGNRLDRVGRSDCPLDAACVGQVAHVTLAAAGSATIVLPLHAAVSVIGENCEELPGRALSPGKYTVQWKTPYSETLLTTNLVVEKLLRLPKHKCRTYAKVVAVKAEPDIKLRRKVERELLVSCKQKQPSQKFADCRMNASTEIELASCHEATLPR